ncbi:uncharacterized protein LOC113228472 [Hyposmocoma kahamanoa]|uniref:uncharacterized protein LOC113228472 n=1 Tax=Hyposmocoma kahamanoa TaxID=1477025 RepID=UPI000E6D941E|nr:uncharacterized protein LOC113228472 [Hyposmocoma kahamanoa]
MSCCCCSQRGSGITGGGGGNLPLICLVPRDEAAAKAAASRQQKGPTQQSSSPSSRENDFQFLDEEYLRKHFNFPQRALYLDPFRKPLITFPISGEKFSKNFSIDRKAKINQQILDGFLDPSEAITAPSVFPYAKTDAEKKKAEEEEEIIYILQLPDWEFKCPVHNETIRTPRFIWHSCKKSSTSSGEMKQGPGPLNKPKPWILSRHTDFDMKSQW